MTVDPRYAEHFKELFKAEGIENPRWDYVDTFDEVPVYSRYQQLEFMSGLNFAEKNRHLTRASVWLLERWAAIAVRHGGAGLARRILFMVSVTDWHTFDGNGRSVCNDGGMDYIVPHIYIANLSNSSMKGFDVSATDYPPALQPPRSNCANYISSALDNSRDYRIYQSPERDWCPERIYVRLLSW